MFDTGAVVVNQDRPFVIFFSILTNYNFHNNILGFFIISVLYLSCPDMVMLLIKLFEFIYHDNMNKVNSVKDNHKIGIIILSYE
jgi:hypothetical protein